MWFINSSPLNFVLHSTSFPLCFCGSCRISAASRLWCMSFLDHWLPDFVVSVFDDVLYLGNGACTNIYNRHVHLL